MSSGVGIKLTKSIKTGKQGQYESLSDRAGLITINATLVRSAIQAMWSEKCFENGGFGSSDDRRARFDVGIVFSERLDDLQNVYLVFR